MTKNSAVVAIKKSTPEERWVNFVKEKMEKGVFNNLMNYSETCLIALTEAPTQNIIAWSSRKYEQNHVNNSILKMISTGYHDDEVWKSVIFQLQSAIYTLHKKNICIYNFNLENNVFIKDTNFDSNNVGYWKYIINGVNFYIPNYGAVLLIDTSFKDLNITGHNFNDKLKNITDDKEKEKEFKYKIMMGDLFEDDIVQKTEITNTNTKLFKEKIFNSKEFDSITDKNAGVIGPSVEIKKVIDNIGKGINNLENIIKNFGDYLHNRVGTFLNETEKKNKMSNKKDFTKGDLVAYNDGNNEEFVVYLETITESSYSSQVKIVRINRKNKNSILTNIETVDSASLSYISEDIKQVFKPNLKLSDEDLIETYNIDF
jgi:hypothetical protein